MFSMKSWKENYTENAFFMSSTEAEQRQKLTFKMQSSQRSVTRREMYLKVLGLTNRIAIDKMSLKETSLQWNMALL